MNGVEIVLIILAVGVALGALIHFSEQRSVSKTGIQTHKLKSVPLVNPDVNSEPTSVRPLTLPQVERAMRQVIIEGYFPTTDEKVRNRIARAMLAGKSEGGFVGEWYRVDALRVLQTDGDRLRELFSLHAQLFASYRTWRAGLDIDVADEFPANRLIKITDEGQTEEQWRERWVRSGGRLYAGQMIALKWDPIWRAISDLGLPYPPFRIGDGMDVEDVDRDEAESIGLIGRRDQIEELNVGPFDKASFQSSVLAAINQHTGRRAV